MSLVTLAVDKLQGIQPFDLFKSKQTRKSQLKHHSFNSIAKFAILTTRYTKSASNPQVKIKFSISKTQSRRNRVGKENKPDCYYSDQDPNLKKNQVFAGKKGFKYQTQYGKFQAMVILGFSDSSTNMILEFGNLGKASNCP